jgi:hypothetical protein
MPSTLAKSLNRVMKKGQSKEILDKKLYKFAQERFDAARTLRRIFEIRWYITRSFVRGEQYVFWNRGAGQLDRHRAIDPRRVRMVDNKILHYVRKQQSKFLRLRPIAEVLPNTNDLDDLDAAELGTNILKHLYRTLEGPKLSRDIANWVTVCGNAFVVDYWDPDAAPGGDVGFEVDSPFAWYFPALSHGPTEVQDMPWAARAKLRALTWIKDKYDYEATAESFTADQNIMMMMRDIDNAHHGLEEVYMPSAVVKEFWIKPGKEYPKGMYFVVINKKIIKKGSFPNYGTDSKPDYQYPVTHFRDITIPGQFWGMATSEAAIPLQKDFNRIRSSIIEWVRTMAKGKWLAPKGSALSPTAIDNEHGEVIEFSPKRGMVPTPVRIPNLPNAVIESLSINQQSFMDLYAQHEVTQGTNKSDIRSGQMVALLLEQDDSSHAMTFQDFEDNWAKMWKHALLLVKKHYKNTRTLKILGAGNKWKIQNFKGADLKNNTDVFVSTGAHLPENKIAKQSVIMERFTQGLYGDPQDPAVLSRVRRMLDDAIPEDIYNEIEADQEFSMNENRMMRNGQVPPINDFDNHNVHIQEHERDVKSGQVQDLIRQGGELGGAVLMAYNSHMKAHAQKLQEQFQMQMQMMAAQQGQGQGGQR